jgi:hypothetical protein
VQPQLPRGAGREADRVRLRHAWARGADVPFVGSARDPLAMPGSSHAPGNPAALLITRQRGNRASHQR